jgi:predicted RNA binding protein YcfA (HicA-like mRNA interferase family)
MPKFPRLGSRQILTVLARRGFYVHHTTGSHVNLRHHTKTNLHVVVPARRRTLAPKTLRAILAQAELFLEDITA